MYLLSHYSMQLVTILNPVCQAPLKPLVGSPSYLLQILLRMPLALARVHRYNKNRPGLAHGEESLLFSIFLLHTQVFFKALENRIPELEKGHLALPLCSSSEKTCFTVVLPSHKVERRRSRCCPRPSLLGFLCSAFSPDAKQ